MSPGRHDKIEVGRIDIRDCLDYGKDPEKTESGKYISAYECDPATVADEFLLAKASYAAMTGREQKKENNVLCYQIRQSFYPGEITPKEANRIGYELAMRWTKGRHAFIVTTHTDISTTPPTSRFQIRRPKTMSLITAKNWAKKVIAKPARNTLCRITSKIWTTWSS